MLDDIKGIYKKALEGNDVKDIKFILDKGELAMLGSEYIDLLSKKIS